MQYNILIICLIMIQYGIGIMHFLMYQLHLYDSSHLNILFIQT